MFYLPTKLNNSNIDSTFSHKLQVRPHIPQFESLQLTLNNPDSSPSCSGSMDSMDTDTLTMEAMEESLSFTTELKSSNIKGTTVLLVICLW